MKKCARGVQRRKCLEVSTGCIVSEVWFKTRRVNQCGNHKSRRSIQGDDNSAKEFITWLAKTAHFSVSCIAGYVGENDRIKSGNVAAIINHYLRLNN